MSKTKSVHAPPSADYKLPPAHRLISTLIFGSRWLQVPLYIGLIFAQCVYVFVFIKELWHSSRTPEVRRAGDHARRPRADRRG